MTKSKMKATSISPANIAFIKYWGKKDAKLNLPYNDSISMNLSSCLTTTTVEFSSHFKKDKVSIDNKKVSGEKEKRVVGILDQVRKKAKQPLYAKVASKNNFPSDAGIASSASAFSALALAASSAYGMKLGKRELSILARLGSGSACRSIPDGFAEWKRGKDSGSSYAVSLAPPNHWEIADVVAIVTRKKKKKSSTAGHQLALTSPYYARRQKELKIRVKNVRESIRKRQFERFGQLIEEEAIDLHLIAMSSRPPVYYWNKGTIEVLNNIRQWREKGLSAFFTLDAGPNVHVICQAKDLTKINSRLKKLPEVLFTITNEPCQGARLTKKHLF